MFLHHPRHPATQCFPIGLGTCFGNQKEKYEENLNNLEHPPGSQTQQTRCCVESICLLFDIGWNRIWSPSSDPMCLTIMSPISMAQHSSINLGGPRGFQIHLHDLEIRSKCLSLGSEMSGRGTQGTQGRAPRNPWFWGSISSFRRTSGNPHLP